MTRLPNLRKEDLDEERLHVWEHMCRRWGTEPVDEKGAMIGPFNAILYTPEIATPLLDLGDALRWRTSLSARTTELAILTVAAHWKAEFEWWAYRRRARASGVPDSIIDAIGAGRDPDFDHDADRAVHAVVRQLVASGSIDKARYDAAHAVLGDGGLVELVTLCGLYTLISFILNGFDVQLPFGEVKQWQ